MSVPLGGEGRKQVEAERGTVRGREPFPCPAPAVRQLRRGQTGPRGDPWGIVGSSRAEQTAAVPAAGRLRALPGTPELTQPPAAGLPSPAPSTPWQSNALFLRESLVTPTNLGPAGSKAWVG